MHGVNNVIAGGSLACGTGVHQLLRPSNSHLQDFLGKRGRLLSKPGANILLFSYAGRAGGSLFVRTALWKPRPKHLVVVAATFKSGGITVTLGLDANHRVVATIASGGKISTMMSGVQKFGSMTVTIVPAKWTASIKTPTMTITAQQVCSVVCTRRTGSTLRTTRLCCLHRPAPATTHLLGQPCALLPSTAPQGGYKRAPKKPSGILVRRLPVVPQLCRSHSYSRSCTLTCGTPCSFRCVAERQAVSVSCTGRTLWREAGSKLPHGDCPRQVGGRLCWCGNGAGGFSDCCCGLSLSI